LPFVNFYKKSKETINRCNKNKPRFHEFSKIAHNEPECSGKNLIDLLTKPVERLPSTLPLSDGIFLAFISDYFYLIESKRYT
jgi:hypothetical protein